MAHGPSNLVTCESALEYPSTRSKGLSSDTSPVAVHKHRSFASTIDDGTHWITRVNQYTVKPASFHQPSTRPLLWRRSMSPIGTAQVTFVREQTRISLPAALSLLYTFTEDRGICVPSPLAARGSLTTRLVTLPRTQVFH